LSDKIKNEKIGVIETAVIDALDEGAVEAHMAAVIKVAGRIDIS